MKMKGTVVVDKKQNHRFSASESHIHRLWLFAVFGGGGNGEQNRQTQCVKTFQKFVPIAMGPIIGSLYKFVEECEPDDLVISPDYSNCLQLGDEEGNDMARSF